MPCEKIVTMTIFGKICAAFSIMIGGVFMILGVIGLFTGANAHFTLPPTLGVLPFFLDGVCVLPWLNIGSCQERTTMKCMRKAYRGSDERMVSDAVLTFCDAERTR